MGMNMRANAVALSAVLFLTGAAAGFLIDRHFITGKKLARYEQFKKFMGPKRFERVQEFLQKKFTRELKLNPQQQEGLRRLLSDGMGKIRERSRQHDAEIEEMKEEMRRAFAETLDPQQKTRFWELVSEYKARRARGQWR